MDMIWPQSTNFGIFYFFIHSFSLTNLNFWTKLYIQDFGLENRWPGLSPMVSFENFVNSMLPSLSALKVTPSFCFAFKIPDNPTTTNWYKCLG